ncbi:MAG: retropepsin-like aspartic protease [Niabella sp.]
MKKIFLSIGFIYCAVAGFAQQKETLQVISLLNNAFRNKSTEALQDVLAKDFSMGTYMGSAAIFGLKSALGNYKLDSFVLEKVQQQDSFFVADLKVVGAKETATKLYLSKAYKIQRMDLLDGLYGMERDKPAIKVATIPFEEDNGSIILNITLNESKRRLRFLFDTGADGMMISTALADSVGLKITKEQNASVVGGNIDIKISAGNIVRLNDFELPQQNIAVYGEANPQHDGIIGNTITKRYITHIDYDKKEMTLYTLGQYTPESAKMKMPVETSTGNILFPAVIYMQEDKPIPGHFTFDTGAGYYLIVFRPTVLKHRMLVSGFVQDSASSTVSMGIATPVFHGKAKSITLAPSWKVNTFPVTLMGGSAANANWNPETSGSLGIRFISQYNFTINLVDRYISFTPRKGSLSHL